MVLLGHLRINPENPIILLIYIRQSILALTHDFSIRIDQTSSRLVETALDSENHLVPWSFLVLKYSVFKLENLKMSVVEVSLTIVHERCVILYLQFRDINLI
jgi:hypothetical protein